MHYWINLISETGQIFTRMRTRLFFEYKNVLVAIRAWDDERQQMTDSSHPTDAFCGALLAQSIFCIIYWFFHCLRLKSQKSASESTYFTPAIRLPLGECENNSDWQFSLTYHIPLHVFVLWLQLDRSLVCHFVQSLHTDFKKWQFQFTKLHLLPSISW